MATHSRFFGRYGVVSMSKALDLTPLLLQLP